MCGYLIINLKIHFICTWTIATGYRYVEQAEIYTQLRPVMYDLAIGHTDHFSFWISTVYFFAIP
jgi:hypothetical protein